MAEIRLTEPSEVSLDFLQKMVDRMATSKHKYGPVAKNYPLRADAMLNMEHRLKKYRKTGNTEWLVDAANFLMIEFMFPLHQRAHFRATGSEESPGLVE